MWTISNTICIYFGFSNTIGTQYTAELLAYCISNKLKNFKLTNLYKEISSSHNADFNYVKWSVENSYKQFKNSKPYNSKYNYMSLKEFIGEKTHIN